MFSSSFYVVVWHCFSFYSLQIFKSANLPKENFQDEDNAGMTRGGKLPWGHWRGPRKIVEGSGKIWDKEYCFLIFIPKGNQRQNGKCKKEGSVKSLSHRPYLVSDVSACMQYMIIRPAKLCQKVGGNAEIWQYKMTEQTFSRTPCNKPFITIEIKTWKKYKRTFQFS